MTKIEEIESELRCYLKAFRLENRIVGYRKVHYGDRCLEIRCIWIRRPYWINYNTALPHYKNGVGTWKRASQFIDQTRTLSHKIIIGRDQRPLISTRRPYPDKASPQH